MKAYVVPVENFCNARCFFCITKFKGESEFGDFLAEENLQQVDMLRDIEAIEVTGGGEPLLHPKIDEILGECIRRRPTILYTNGKLLARLSPETKKGLKLLTISRHHFDEQLNEKIMKLRVGEEEIRQAVAEGGNVRLTAVLCASGMKGPEEVAEYIAWAGKLGVSQVQIRQLFEYEYGDALRHELVKTEEVLEKLIRLGPELQVREEKYPTVYMDGVRVEFEGDKCACQVGGPTLRGNGKMYLGWTKKELPSGYFQ